MPRRSPSRLVEEASPFLLRHSQDPVDWTPFGPEPFARAAARDLPVLVHVGRTAAAALQAVAAGVFRDASVAARLNRDFVCVLVDGDERPLVDDLACAVSQSVTGRAGSPCTVFFTPDGRPFFAGTSLVRPGGGDHPGFEELLVRLSALWQGERSTLQVQADELSAAVALTLGAERSASASRDWSRRAARALEERFDPAFGGAATLPKAPPAAELALLLRSHRAGETPGALALATRTLDALMTGAVYDQLGGGFFAEVYDRAWLAPRFDKELTQNALLAEVYLDAAALTGDARYERVARATLDCLVRDMQSPTGGFFVRLLDGTETGDGGPYTWTRRELVRVLGEPAATRAALFFGVEEQGPFSGRSALTVRRPLTAVASELGVAVPDLLETLEKARLELLMARAASSALALDDTVLALPTGLAIRALSHGASALGERRYLAAAERGLAFLRAHLLDEQGGLLRAAREGGASPPAELEDYAALGDGLVSLHEAGGGPGALELASSLATRVLEEFGRSDGGFATRGAEPLGLLSGPRGATDSNRPSGVGLAARLLARLARHTQSDALWERAAAAIRSAGGGARREPARHATLLEALALLLEPGRAGGSARHELSGSALRGGATAEATRRASLRGALPEAAYASLRCLAGVRVSRVGVGTYRSGLDLPAHRDALRHALESGLNLIDTAPSFALGDAERLVGEVLAELVAAGRLERDELVVVTKLGVAVGADAARLAAGPAARASTTLPLSASAAPGAGMFCLEPSFLAEQLSASLERLALERVDLCLLQSPEHLLLAGQPREAYRSALRAAFGQLEAEVAAGRLGAYGVLTNTASRPKSDPARVELEELTLLAGEAAGGPHHLGVVALPMNLLERGALEGNQDEGAEGAALARAAALGLDVLALRPLTALEGGALRRLVDPPAAEPGATGLDLGAARYRVESLEAEFETTLGARLRLSGFARTGRALGIGGALARTVERVASLEQLNHAEATLLSPRLRQNLAELDQALSGPELGEWLRLRARYLAAVGTWLAAVRERARSSDRTFIESLRRKHGAREEEPTAALALRTLLARPELGAALVGLRSIPHVDAALAALRAASAARAS